MKFAYSNVEVLDCGEVIDAEGRKGNRFVLEALSDSATSVVLASGPDEATMEMLADALRGRLGLSETYNGWCHWGSFSGILATLKYVVALKEPYLAVHWHGYAGNAPDFDLYPMAREPKRIADLAAATGMDAEEIAYVAEDGYVQWIARADLADGLSAMLEDPDGDPEKFMCHDGWNSPMDLKGWAAAKRRYEREND
jgi:hypothetical protein